MTKCFDQSDNLSAHLSAHTATWCQAELYGEVCDGEVCDGGDCGAERDVEPCGKRSKRQCVD